MFTTPGILILVAVLAIAGGLGLLLGRAVLAWSWWASGGLAVGFVFLVCVILVGALFWLLSLTDIG